jgi:hypothetical protein
MARATVLLERRINLKKAEGKRFYLCDKTVSVDATILHFIMSTQIRETLVDTINSYTSKAISFA